MRVALCLGSGGARGYAHIGVIDELRDRGFDVPRRTCRSLEFHRAAEVIEVGRELAVAALDALDLDEPTID